MIPQSISGNPVLYALTAAIAYTARKMKPQIEKISVVSSAPVIVSTANISSAIVNRTISQIAIQRLPSTKSHPQSQVLGYFIKMYTKAKAAYLYAFGIGGCIFGATYLLPPFYSTFCEKSGFGGADAVRAEYETVHDPSKLHRKFTISFESMVEPELKWSFWPLQETVEMNSGDTVLAFFRAYNDEPNPIIGISSYVIIPD
jgi:hypothetical protein